MLDEARPSESGFHFGQSRYNRDKKKSTDDSLAARETEISKEEATYPTSESLAKPEPTSKVIPKPIPESIQRVEEPPSSMITPSANGRKETPSLYRRKEKSEEVLTSVDTKEDHYTDEAVENVWREFGQMRLVAGAGDAEKLVLSRKLDNEEGNEITIHLGSQLEMTILEKIEKDLVQFLRKGLHNDLIVLMKQVAEQQTTQKLYTSQDKYDHMVEQNPALKTLKEKLGLDFEY